MAFDAYNQWDMTNEHPWVRNGSSPDDLEEEVNKWHFVTYTDFKFLCSDTTNWVSAGVQNPLYDTIQCVEPTTLTMNVLGVAETDIKIEVEVPDIHYRCWYRTLSSPAGSIEIFISFRGTVVEKFGNIITDLDLFQVCLDPETMTETVEGSNGIFVHRGFLKAWSKTLATCPTR